MREPGPSAYDVAGHYDAAYYDDLLERYRRRTRFARRRIENVFKLLPALEGRFFLDLGCGMGTFAIEAARRGARAVGVDFTPAALPAARSAAREAGIVASFVQADAVALPLRSACVDVALAADLTEHLDSATLDGTAAEMARVMRPGAAVVLYTPSPTHFLERLRAARILPADPSHIGLRTADTLAATFMRHGFTVRRTVYLPSHVPGLDVIERGFGRHIGLLRRRIGMVLERAGQ